MNELNIELHLANSNDELCIVKDEANDYFEINTYSLSDLYSFFFKKEQAKKLADFIYANL